MACFVHQALSQPGSAVCPLQELESRQFAQAGEAQNTSHIYFSVISKSFVTFLLQKQTQEMALPCQRLSCW